MSQPDRKPSLEVLTLEGRRLLTTIPLVRAAFSTALVSTAGPRASGTSAPEIIRIASMGNSEPASIARLEGVSGYSRSFASSFVRPTNPTAIVGPSMNASGLRSFPVLNGNARFIVSSLTNSKVASPSIVSSSNSANRLETSNELGRPLVQISGLAGSPINVLKNPNLARNYSSFARLG